jgi:hypothetical protein
MYVLLLNSQNLSDKLNYIIMKLIRGYCVLMCIKFLSCCRSIAMNTKMLEFTAQKSRLQICLIGQKDEVLTRF